MKKKPKVGDKVRIIGINPLIMFGLDTPIVEVLDVFEDNNHCCFVQFKNQQGTIHEIYEGYFEILEEEPEISVNALGGIKEKEGKVQYGYLLKDLPRACTSVTKVLMYGGKKYDRLNWSKVQDEDYEEALLRHQMKIFLGEELDPETKEPHLSHLICNAMFLLEKKLRRLESENAIREFSREFGGID